MFKLVGRSERTLKKGDYGTGLAGVILVVLAIIMFGVCHAIVDLVNG